MSKKFYNNVIKILLSNMLIVGSGVVSGFFLPKLLGVTDYGYYKIFNLYTTYIVFFDIGISNGIYLMYGGCQLNEIPKTKFRFYFKVLFTIQLLSLAVITFVAAVILQHEYRFIFVMVGIYLLVNNVANYFEKISVMAGEFDAVVRRNILKSMLTIIIILILWMTVRFDVSIKYYKVYTILFVLVYGVLAIQYVYSYKELIFGAKENFFTEKENLKRIVKSGMILLLADMISSLILNLDRQFVSLLFDVDTYSVYSFAYSMLKIVMLGVSAISSVMYPTLKRLSIDEIKGTYSDSISLVGIISFGCLTMYYPLCMVVEWFLPSYINSLPIFRILFPSIAISSIISMIMINHYKVLQKQKMYFLFSIAVLIVSVFSNIIAYFLLHKPIGFSAASVFTMLFWYAISDIYLSVTYKVNTVRHYVYLLINIFIFYMISGVIENYYLGFVWNILFFGLSSFCIYRRELMSLLIQSKSKIGGKSK